MLSKKVYKSLLFGILLLCMHNLQAQDILRNIGNRIPHGGGGSGGNDSLERRSKYEDSITIRFRYLDVSRNYTFDSSISDYDRRFPIPATYHYLGNPGTAARSILFSPLQQVGFDPGLHSFDVYRLMVDKIRFFNTTRPYTELGFMLGSNSQQMLEAIHTQNIKPYLNISFQYRLINSPGFFRNQSVNHNNYLFTSWYQAPKKRYNNYLILLGNKLQASENGGILSDEYLSNPFYEERLSIPTKLGPTNSTISRTPFGTSLVTGNDYREFVALLRQQYDLGQKDSIVTDTTVIPLFYPRIRFEHTLQYSSKRFRFQDFAPDSNYYLKYYNYQIDTGIIAGQDTVLLEDRWQLISNDFSIYTFPDAKNLQQFLKLGAELQLWNGRSKRDSWRGKESFANVMLHGEYRNRTRNQKWDMQAAGKLFLTGYNKGDYHAYVSLQRLISSKLGSLQVGFENSNSEPGFAQDPRSGFYLDDPTKLLNKENISHFFAAAINPKLKLQLGADYYLIGNYIYYKDFYRVEQEGSLFNVLRLSALKTFRLSRHFNWYAEVYLQQKTGNVEVNMPLLLTRNRFAFEGNFFKNLFLSTGFEVRYHNPYDADNYSPVIGQFAYQDTATISNRPDIHYFFNFRIRGFQAFVRAENLNTIDFLNGLSFTHNNFAAPEYPYPGFALRLAIYWSFVN